MILLASPVSKIKEYCLFDWINHINNLNGDFDVLLIDNSDDFLFLEKLKLFVNQLDKNHNIFIGSIEKSFLESHYSFIARSQESIRLFFLSNKKYKKLFLLECDVFVPTIDTINRLDAHNLPVVSGLYFWNDNYVMFNHFYEYENGQLAFELQTCDYILNENLDITQPIFVHNAGFGCTMISRSVLKNISFRHEYPNRAVHSDVLFAEDLFFKNITWYLDTSIICEHRHRDWGQQEKELYNN